MPSPLSTSTNPDFVEGLAKAKADYSKATAMNLCCVIAAFDADPPDTPYQHGYLTALYEILTNRLLQLQLC